jgi:hypothetical protein
MRNRTTAGLLAASMMMATSIANAQEQSFGPFPYNYAYVNYASTDLSSNGYEVGGSFDVADRVNVFAAYQDWDLSNNFNRTTLQVGAGYRWNVSPNADVSARVAYADTRIRRPGPPRDIEGTGLIASGEIRGWAARQLELSGVVALDSSGRSGVDPVLEFGGQYYFNGSFSLGGRLRLDEDDSTVFLGGRFHFGNLTRR